MRLFVPPHSAVPAPDATPVPLSSTHPMRRALALARRALPSAHPNPAVGAVVVHHGEIVGQGFTQPPGQAHAEVVALCDNYKPMLTRSASKVPGAALVEDYRAVLDNKDVQAVIIATPTHLHREIAVAALQAGKHVLCEKPMAASLEECDAMIAAATASGRLLSVVFQNRFRPDIWRAKHLAAGGHLGRLLFGLCATLWYRGPNYYDLWWRGTWEQECGGATLNHAIHDIDAFLWIMGEPASLVAEMDTQAHAIEVEDLAIALVRFANGALGQVTSTVNAHQNRSILEIVGQRAAVSIPWTLSACRPDERGFPQPDPARLADLAAAAEAVPLPPGQGHGAQVGDVLRALETGGRPLVDGPEGRRSVEFVTALYKAATTGQRVQFPLTPSDPFYTTAGLHAHVRRAPVSRQAGPGTD